MEARYSYADERQISHCSYCREETGTRDHVPSKVFLDKPYPENLPVVFCCAKCNQGFSLDEQYVACLIECIQSGSYELDKIQRESIRKSLKRSPSLLNRIKESSKVIDGVLGFKPEEERLLKVLLKNAKGHLLFEFNFPVIDENINIDYNSLSNLSEEQRIRFETPPALTKMPEAGCRAGQNICIINEEILCLPWIEVQPGLYRYLVGYDNGYLVRVVIGECIACEVFIED